MNGIFRKISVKTANLSGRASTFVVAILLVVVWAATGPMFNYADTWQLVINTATTVITFLMVFLIQNTQNRDSKSLHLKLDELIRAQKTANNSFLDLDSKTDDELDVLGEKFTKIGQKIKVEKEERVEKEKHHFGLHRKDKKE